MTRDDSIELCGTHALLGGEKGQYAYSPKTEEKKHPRMANENPTVTMYHNILLEIGALPFPTHEYSGF